MQKFQWYNVGKCIFCSDTHFYFIFESTLAEQARSLVIEREVEADPEIGEGQGHHVEEDNCWGKCPVCYKASLLH